MAPFSFGLCTLGQRWGEGAEVSQTGERGINTPSSPPAFTPPGPSPPSRPLRAALHSQPDMRGQGGGHLDSESPLSPKQTVESSYE